MIKHTLTTVIALVCFSLNAQEFQGKAEYFTKIILKKSGKGIEVKSDEDAEMKTAIEDALKKATQKKFILTFNKQECVYEEMQELQKPKAASGEVSFEISFSNQGKKYINIKNKSKIIEDEIFGKEFLITEKLEPFDWTLVNETKKIGDYNCFKAEVILPVSDKQKQAYQEQLKENEKQPSLFPLREPIPKKIIAWYSPEIPVNLGPNNYWGLPGLILEINEDESIVLCSKITLKSKETSKIKVPNKGKKVSQEEFDATQKKMYDSMKDKDGNIIFQTQE